MKEKTTSEKMQDNLEPIPCPMHEDYDDDWLTHQKKEKEILDMSMKESIRQRDERKEKVMSNTHNEFSENTELTCAVLLDQCDVFKERIREHDTGYLYDTISTLIHRIKELRGQAELTDKECGLEIYSYDNLRLKSHK